MRKGGKGIKLLALIGVVAAASLIFSSGSPPPAGAQGSDELYGWAWSSNIGWVSLNCSDRSVCSRPYAVQFNSATGVMSGYAWSSSIGWIDFRPSGPYPAAGPQYSARFDLSSGEASGWARALSGDPASGWDGWIKMAGTADDGSPYSVQLSGNRVTGFAWGSDVVGWLNFDVTPGGSEPRCPIFEPDPRRIIITPGGSGQSTLSWQCENVTSCSIDQGIGSVPNPGSELVTLNQTTFYTLSCEGGGGATATAFVEIQVFTPDRKEVRP